MRCRSLIATSLCVCLWAAGCAPCTGSVPSSDPFWLALKSKLNHRSERARSLPQVVRAGFDRETRGAEPTQVVWQRLGTGLELYEIEYIDEFGEEREAHFGCDGLPLSPEEVLQYGRRVAK